MKLAQYFLADFDAEMQNTRKLLALVPEQHTGYQPHEKSMTIARVAGHVADLPKLATAIAQTESMEIQRGQPPYLFTSSEDALKTFDTYVAQAREAVAQLSDEKMLANWKLTFAGRIIVDEPRVHALRKLMLHHLIHHRAQLGVFLRLKEVEIPGMYGPSYDEMKHWTTAAG